MIIQETSVNTNFDYKVTILGCGPSSGIPAANGYWGDCNSLNEKNRRQRSCILVQYSDHNILIDTSPDLKNQLLNNKISQIDAVLYTHAHSDHILGIHDLSFFSSNTIDMHKKDKLYTNKFTEAKKIIPVYGSINTLLRIVSIFSYMFNKLEDSKSEDFSALIKKHITLSNIQKDLHLFENYLFPFNLDEDASKTFTAYPVFENFSLFSKNIKCIDQDHTNCISTGFIFDKFAYSTDVFALSEKSLDQLKNIDLWIVSCAKYNTSYEKHASFDKVMSWINYVQPKKAILTHMGMDMDYEKVSKILPPNVILAYDNMQIYI